MATAKVNVDAMSAGQKERLEMVQATGTVFTFAVGQAEAAASAKRKGRGIDPSYAPLYTLIEYVMGGNANAADVTGAAATAIAAKNERGGKVVDANTVVRSLGAKYGKRGWSFRAVDCGSHSGLADACDPSLLAPAESLGMASRSGSHILAYRTPAKEIAN